MPAHALPLVPVVHQHQSVFDAINGFVTNWSQTIMLVLFTALLAILWRTVKSMPRTGPARLKPDASPQISWEEIAGADDAKDELREVVEFLREPKRFRALGARVPQGILLHGPPGTGKTLLAKAAAHESGAQFFAQSAASPAVARWATRSTSPRRIATSRPAMSSSSS